MVVLGNAFEFRFLSGHGRSSNQPEGQRNDELNGVLAQTQLMNQFGQGQCHAIDLWRPLLPDVLQALPTWRLAFFATALPGILFVPMILLLPINKRALALPQPGGPAVQAEAALGDVRRVAFPRPLLDRPGCDMSFSGLKTALLRARDALVAEKGGLTVQDRRDLCAGFQEAVADVLVEKSRRALEMYLALSPAVPVLAVAGGVAANAVIRAKLMALCDRMGVQFLAPPLALCTDNAAMIAWAGMERFRTGARDDAALVARPRWPLDQTAAPMIGSGKKGAKA